MSWDIGVVQCKLVGCGMIVSTNDRLSKPKSKRTLPIFLFQSKKERYSRDAREILSLQKSKWNQLWDAECQKLYWHSSGSIGNFSIILSEISFYVSYVCVSWINCNNNQVNTLIINVVWLPLTFTTKILVTLWSQNIYCSTELFLVHLTMANIWPDCIKKDQYIKFQAFNTKVTFI